MNNYKYYKINDGYYFRCNQNNTNFQVLKNNLWEDNNYMYSIFIDPYHDYCEVIDENIIKILSSYPNKENSLRK